MEDLTPFQDNIIHEQKSNFIHPTAIVGEDVVLGFNNYIGAYCVITGNTKIGDNNRFEAFCSIGSEPEHKAYFGKPNKGLIIGDDNIIREYVTINAGCERPTLIQNNVVMLRGSHIGHDSIIEDNCTISCNVLVGGHSIVGERANLGLGAILHQYSIIGNHSMLGMGTIVTKKSLIEPFTTYIGSPAKYLCWNNHLLNQYTLIERIKIIDDFSNRINRYKNEF